MDKVSFEQHLSNKLTSFVNQNLVVACSTGVDSMALLRALMNIWPHELITVAHVNHQKRIESNEEEKYIQDFCFKHNLKCYIEKLNYEGNDNFQEWARNKRYMFFEKVLTKTNSKILLTAHHADDNLETIIMRFIKSSNLLGYAGIKEISAHKNYQIVRPLLSISKKDIYEYMHSQEYHYFEDVSNESTIYTRNRIRKDIVPVIKKENPNWLKSLQDYSETLIYAGNILKNQVNLFIKDNVCVNNNIIKVDQNKFLELDDFMQKECLFTILFDYKLSKICIEEIIKQIKSSKTTIISNINNDLLFIKEYGYLLFTSHTEELNYYLEINQSGEYDLPDNRKIIVSEEFKNIIYFEPTKGKMCYNIQDLPIVIRTKKPGDKIKTKGGTKKVNDIMTNKKVSHIYRPHILVLENKDQEIIEILGFKK